MKKTKLLTSIAALALVLSLGACTEPTEEETTSEESGVETTDTESSSAETEVSTEGAYAIVGDFVDADWVNEPATDSKYFIPAETEEFKVTVTTAGEPTDNEWWTETNQWDAGLSVVEYGTWNRVAGYTELDASSTGVKGSSSSNDVSLAWNTTYDVTLTFGETNSILVTEKAEGEVEGQYEDNTITEMLNAIEQDCNYNATTYYLLEQSNAVDYNQEAMANAEVGIVQGFATDIYATEDAIEIDYLQYLTADNSYGYPEGWYYMDFEIYANDYTTNEMVPYYYYYGYMIEGSRESGTWQDYIWSLADLVEYKSAFTVEDSYYGIEEYAVDEDALDTLLNATIGNNYVWNDLFSGGVGGWNYYFGFADAADIFSFVTADTSGLLYGEPFLEVAFTDGGAWYYASTSDHEHVVYQEVVAYTDIFLDTLGEIDLASLWED